MSQDALRTIKETETLDACIVFSETVLGGEHLEKVSKKFIGNLSFLLNHLNLVVVMVVFSVS